MSTTGPRTYPSYIVRYAAGQFLSNAAYNLAQKSVPELDVMNVAGSHAEGFHTEFAGYTVKPFKLKKGMFGFILLPLDKSSKDVKVIFRGTDMDDPKSLAINFETWGPGSISFEQEKANIFNTFDSAIKEHFGTDLPETIEGSGHSQGAAFIQMFMAEFLTRRAYQNKYDSFKNLNMTVFNSPGVPDSYAQEAMEAVLLQWYNGRAMKIVTNYCMVGGDAIQTTGNNMIFSLLSSFFAQVNLLKVDIGLEGAWLRDIHLADGLQPIELIEAAKSAGFATFGAAGAHRSVKFYDPNTNEIKIGFKYEYYTNENPQDVPIIRKELLNKSRVAQCLSYVSRIIGHPLEYKEDYQLWFGKTFVNSAYDKVSRWFSRNGHQVELKFQQEAKMQVTSGDKEITYRVRASSLPD